MTYDGVRVAGLGAGLEECLGAGLGAILAVGRGAGRAAGLGEGLAWGMFRPGQALAGASGCCTCRCVAPADMFQLVRGTWVMSIISTVLPAILTNMLDAIRCFALERVIELWYSCEVRHWDG